MNESIKEEKEEKIINQILDNPNSFSKNNSANITDLDNINNTNNKINTTSFLSSNPVQVQNIEEINKTNCLALTIKEEHKLVAVKNVFVHSLKVTCKVIASAIALHILKIFL